MLYRSAAQCLLNVTENVHVNEGRKYIFSMARMLVSPEIRKCTPQIRAMAMYPFLAFCYRESRIVRCPAHI